MTQDANSTASPCIGVCTIDEDSGFCLGCARSLKEVTHWRRLSDAQKAAINVELHARRERLKALGIEMRNIK